MVHTGEEAEGVAISPKNTSIFDLRCMKKRAGVRAIVCADLVFFDAPRDNGLPGEALRCSHEPKRTARRDTTLKIAIATMFVCLVPTDASPRRGEETSCW